MKYCRKAINFDLRISDLKLYFNKNGLFTLYDEFDNEIGSTECDNIEDALEELQKQSDLSI